MADSENNASQMTTKSVIELYTKELNTIIKTTYKKYGRSIEASGGGIGSPRFFAYWHEALSVASRGIELGIINVPDYDIRPPVSKLHINFFTKSTRLLDWPDIDPCISLNMPDGIKKGQIALAVADYLYAKDAIPIIHTSDDNDWSIGGKYLACRWA